jgi:hypothetical protein
VHPQTGVNTEEEEKGEDRESITMQKVEEAIKQTRIGKAAGEDNIAPEFIKYRGQKVKHWILDLFRQVWKKIQYQRFGKEM